MAKESKSTEKPKEDKPVKRPTPRVAVIIGLVIVCVLMVVGYMSDKNWSLSKEDMPADNLGRTGRTINNDYPTEANPAVVIAGIGDGAHKVPFDVPDNMTLEMWSWDNENFRYRDETWSDWHVVIPGYVNDNRKSVRVIIESLMNKPIRVKYYLKPK